MSLLKKITSPADLKLVSKEQLPALAEEIREFLIDSVSKTGGHLAPSLGVVELTLVLHYLFETPKDKFVWDVGHQAYPHKMLTGRMNQFHTLRQHEGISGFPHITESEHDAFTVGHASTSISAALGLAKARDIAGKEGEVIAIIGDGAMTGGLAFEALNNLGHSDTKMTVILNDNEMSIAPNVGAMSKYLTKIITDKKFNKLKTNVWKMLDQMPKVRKGIQSAVHNFDDTVKKVITPGKFFEDMGIPYIGPVDGHNLDELMAVLKYARDDHQGPLLIHVLTHKGRGYHPAENNATKFHGIGSFEKDTGEVITSKGGNPSWSAIFGSAMEEIVEKDSSVVAITAAMPDGTGLGSFQKKFPKNIIDVGIAEGHAVTFAGGLSLNGVKPVVAIYSSFLQRAFDHTIHDVALENLDVVFCLDRAGVVGNDGPTHHGCYDLSYLRAIPNATILAPSNAQDLRDMLYSALYNIKGPVFIRYPRGNSFGEIKASTFTSQPSFAPLEVETGVDTLLISAGHFLPDVLKTAELLNEKDISSTILDLRTIKPLNKEVLVPYLKKFETIFTFEQNAIRGGVGAALMECASELFEEGLLEKTPTIIPIGYPDHFIEQGNISDLMKDLGLTPEAMTKRIVKIIKK